MLHKWCSLFEQPPQVEQASIPCSTSGAGCGACSTSGAGYKTMLHKWSSPFEHPPLVEQAVEHAPLVEQAI